MAALPDFAKRPQMAAIYTVLLENHVGRKHAISPSDFGKELKERFPDLYRNVGTSSVSMKAVFPSYVLRNRGLIEYEVVGEGGRPAKEMLGH